MVEHHIAGPRTARYFTIGTPGAQIGRLWYVLHGHGQLAERFLREFEVLDDGATLVVAPEGLSRMYLRGGNGTIGASWMTSEDRLNEISDYVGYLNLLHSRLIPQLSNPGLAITLLGFSQGAATAGRWLASGGIAATQLLLCGGLLPPEFLPQQLGQTSAAFVIGREDSFVNREELQAQRTALQSAGKAVQVVEFDGGHRVPASELGRFLSATHQHSLSAG